MLLKLLTLYYLFAGSFAWLPPERCQQDSRRRRSVVVPPIVKGSASSVRNITDVATKQHEGLLEKYKDYKFYGIPIRGSTSTPSYKMYPEEFDIYAPFSCDFYTYDPQLLSTVNCNNAECHLSRTVSTVSSYSSTEEYNWGVTLSAQVTFAEVFEVGGSASTGGSYSCTYTKEKSVSDTVQCSDTKAKGGQLQLYSVRSDMMCDFGENKLTRDGRDNGLWNFSFSGILSNFTTVEIEQLRNSVQVSVGPRGWFVMDTSKISSPLLQKLMNKVPLYNPYTDLLMVDRNDIIRVLYFKKTGAVKQTKNIIPFTNESGNSIYQYACMKI